MCSSPPAPIALVMSAARRHRYSLPVRARRLRCASRCRGGAQTAVPPDPANAAAKPTPAGCRSRSRRRSARHTRRPWRTPARWLPRRSTTMRSPSWTSLPRERPARAPGARFLKAVALTDQSKVDAAIAEYRSLAPTFPRCPSLTTISPCCTRARVSSGSRATSFCSPCKPPRLRRRPRKSGRRLRRARRRAIRKGSDARQAQPQRVREAQARARRGGRDTVVRNRIDSARGRLQMIRRTAARFASSSPSPPRWPPAPAPCREPAGGVRHHRRQDQDRALSRGRAEDRRELPRLRRRPATTTARSSTA